MQNDTGDTYNPFVIELSIANQKQALNFIDGSGNETLYSLDGEPSIQLAQTPKVQVSKETYLKISTVHNNIILLLIVVAMCTL